MWVGASRPARSLCSSQDCGKPLSIEADDNGQAPLDGHVLCLLEMPDRATEPRLSEDWPPSQTTSPFPHQRTAHSPISGPPTLRPHPFTLPTVIF